MRLSYQNFHIHASTLKLCKFIFPSVFPRLGLNTNLLCCKSMTKYYFILVWCWFTLALKLPWTGWMGFTWELGVPQKCSLHVYFMLWSSAQWLFLMFPICSPRVWWAHIQDIWELRGTFNGRTVIVAESSF
jgi:hypothetical protein